MLWLATARPPAVKVATPPLRVPVPNVVAPSLKVTVPVGVPVPGGVADTVAVKVTACPDTVGLADEASAVAVAAWFTAWDSAGDVLPVKFGSPPYTAVMPWLATDRPLAVKVATPPLSVPVPSVVAPSLNVTVPVGVPEPGGVA